MTDNTLIDETLETLKDLMQTCQDGEYGFRSSADSAQADDLRALLKRRAEACKAQAAELAAHVIRLGGEPDSGTTASSALHRSWVAVQSVLPSYTDLALLQECERVEDEALERYADALNKPLEAAAKEVIDSQRLSTQRSHDEIRAMRDHLQALG